MLKQCLKHSWMVQNSKQCLAANKPHLSRYIHGNLLSIVTRAVTSYTCMWCNWYSAPSYVIILKYQPDGSKPVSEMMWWIYYEPSLRFLYATLGDKHCQCNPAISHTDNFLKTMPIMQSQWNNLTLTFITDGL